MTGPDEARQTFGEGVSEQFLDRVADSLGADAEGAVAAYADLGEPVIEPLVEFVEQAKDRLP